MTDQPSKWLTAIPTILLTLAGALVTFGAAYAQWAADNPEQAGWLGWSSLGIGAITGIAGLVVQVANQMKAANAPPAPPKIDGEVADAVDHTVSIAVQQAMNRGDHTYAKALVEVVAANSKVKP